MAHNISSALHTIEQVLMQLKRQCETQAMGQVESTRSTFTPACETIFLAVLMCRVKMLQQCCHNRVPWLVRCLDASLLTGCALGNTWNPRRGLPKFTRKSSCRARLDERRIGEILRGIDMSSMGTAFVGTASRLLSHLGDVMTLAFTPAAPAGKLKHSLRAFDQPSTLQHSF